MPDDVDLVSLSDFTKEMICDAGTLLLDGLRDRSLRQSAIAKTSPTDIATQTDRAIETLIVQRIRSVFPDDGIVGEEGSNNASRNGRRWIIDPLDGTANFVRRLWPSVISIAVEIDDIAVVGVVFDPAHNELYTAIDGRAAYCNGRLLDRSKDEVSMASAFVGFSATHPVEQAPVFRNLLTEQADSVRDLGSTALHLCYVADGRYDAHVAMGVKRWDVAAGFLIAREAGCGVEGFVEGEPPSPDQALISVPSLMHTLRAAAEEAGGRCTPNAVRNAPM